MSLLDWVKLRFASRRKPNPLPETSTMPSAYTGGGGGVAGIGGAGGCTRTGGTGLGASMDGAGAGDCPTGGVEWDCDETEFSTVTGVGVQGTATSAGGVETSRGVALATLRRVRPIFGVRVRGRFGASLVSEFSFAAALVLGLCSSSVMVKNLGRVRVADIWPYTGRHWESSRPDGVSGYRGLPKTCRKSRTMSVDGCFKILTSQAEGISTASQKNDCSKSLICVVVNAYS